MRSSRCCLALALLSSPAMSLSAVARPALQELTGKLQAITHLERASAVLGWDQLVTMPPDASEARGAQLAALAGVVHEKSTSPELGAAIRAAEAEAASSPWSLEEARDGAVVREARRTFDRQTLVPTELAERAAKLGSEAYAAWAKARAASDFKSFEGTLERCFTTAAEMAVAKAGGREGAEKAGGVYAACLEDYERGMSQARIDELFAQVEERLQPLIQEVLASEHAPCAAALEGDFSVGAQEALSLEVVEAMGFPSGTRGRVDVSVHPFTTSFGPRDVRITSRFRPDEWYQGLAGSVHECGHALYEGQLRDSALPVDTALSMGVHESQSLFWERHVGLSKPFWRWCGPLARRHLGLSEKEEAGASDSGLYGACNRVSRGLIRVEADELTYPMHVVLRYRLEAKILAGDLQVGDLPQAWNEGMRELLGVDQVPSDALGCLQDVHWSGLAVGYFPTYLLGAMMAAQLDFYLRRDPEILAVHGPTGGVDGLIERGEFGPLREWLRCKVHDKGSVPGSMDALLVEEFGEPLKADYLLDYLEDKYRDLYQIAK